MGGPHSGKSAFAEDLFKDFHGKKYYIATLMVCDREGEERVARHRSGRADKGFITLEVLRNVDRTGLDLGSGVLLECATNLLANEMFEGGLGGKPAAEKCVKNIIELSARAEYMVVVTTDPGDWEAGDIETEEYAAAQKLMNDMLLEEAREVCRF